MENIFEAVSFDAKNIGKIIKSSKSKSNWKFIFKNKECELSLTSSKFSGNYSIFLNTKLLYKGNKTFDSNFQFKIKLEKQILLIRQISGVYKVIFNNKNFEDYYPKNKKDELSNNQEIRKCSSKKDMKQKIEHEKNKKYRHVSLNPVFGKKISDSDVVEAKDIKKNILKNSGDSKNLNNKESGINSKVIKDEVNEIYEFADIDDKDSYSDSDASLDENENENEENKKVVRTRFTKDFEDFEDMEIFIFPNDFPRQTPKIKKVVDNVNNEF